MKKAAIRIATLCKIIYISCFFIPNINLSIPLKNLGLLNKTTFIKITSDQYLRQLTPNTITAMASTATRNSLGQMHASAIPSANAIAKIPLFTPHFFRILPPPQ